tara:strand:+ start:956 stop:1780 length:825 start_codon:yes stop_codon:yes gene_type:complete
MNRFIAAMDHSGGSTGGVLERYEQEYTEENKMDLVNDMRLRMINSPDFTSDNIWAMIFYKDSVDRGLAVIANTKDIKPILKIDSGIAENGTLKPFDLRGMIQYAKEYDCWGTKMRSMVHDSISSWKIVEQQFNFAQDIIDAGLVPIIEPEVPINHPQKRDVELSLREDLRRGLKNIVGNVILKLTIPDNPTVYDVLHEYNSLFKMVGLSGGYSTEEACRKLSYVTNMSASFSRGLSEGLFAHQTEEEFNTRISENIKMIKSASIPAAKWWDQPV